ncbi:MAG: hypothetical protein JSV47_08355 [Deltaproteobacteria bacterium]|nr:MAG: hypothetical protein JSV47_08355 [Deltaproteobacteria bacterium]
MIAERFLACQRQKRLQNTIIIFRLGNVVRWGMEHGAWGMEHGAWGMGMGHGHGAWGMGMGHGVDCRF